MKVKISNLLASFAAVFLITFSVQAQEDIPMMETPDPNHVNLDEDKSLNGDHPIHLTPSLKDSIQSLPKLTPASFTKPVKPDATKNTRKEKDEDDDALSFNFLYYMFQKFKMSDLIDQ